MFARRLFQRCMSMPHAAPLNPRMPPLHIPVMSTEVMDNLQPEAGDIFIDMTFGAGGHTRQILDASPSTTKVIALDRDADAYQLACDLKRAHYPDRLFPLLGRFSELPTLLKTLPWPVSAGTVDGILFDFGCSSMQFDRAERGFAISKCGPLDMRMERHRNDTPTVAEVLARIEEPDLARILKVYGEEKNAKKIARAIVDMRYSLRKIETTKELCDLIASCFTGTGDDGQRVDKLGRPSHVATKTFQALRIFVNDELNEINYGMLVASHLLRVNVGRLVTLTFHSLEDTIVKRHLMGHLVGAGQMANPLPLRYSSHAVAVDDAHELMTSLMTSGWQQMHKHVLVPSDAEVDRNPRSRSAKLRAALRVSDGSCLVND